MLIEAAIDIILHAAARYDFSRCSSNSEAFASVLLENLETECFLATGRVSELKLNCNPDYKELILKERVIYGFNPMFVNSLWMSWQCQF